MEEGIQRQPSTSRCAAVSVLIPRLFLLGLFTIISCTPVVHGAKGVKFSAGLVNAAKVGQRRSLIQQEEPQPIPVAPSDLPDSFKKSWKEVFPTQWEAYETNLGAVKVGKGPSLLDAGKLLFRDKSGLLNPTQLRRSVAYTGGLHRIRRVLRDLQGGKEVKLGVIGGSISWGSAVERGGTDWFSVLVKRLQVAFPKAKVVGNNGCVPATPSSFMNLCLEHYLDDDVDLVFVEYAVNDGWDLHNSGKRKVYERLIRKVLRLKKRPAVVLMQLPTVGMAFAEDHPRKKHFSDTMEDVYGSVAAHYDLPYLSMRNAIWRLAEFHHYRMNFTNWYGERYDFIHPLDYGHATIADIASYLLHLGLLDLTIHPWSEWDEQELQLGLPNPMFPGNYEELNRLCMHGKELEVVVKSKKDWDMVNEGKGQKQKWGYISTKVGAQLRVAFNTTPSSQGSFINVQLGYLKSYTKMGQAKVSCVSGCSCRTMYVDGYHEYRVSTVYLLPLQPSPASSCELEVEVLPDSSSGGGHKFKVTGIMVNELRGKVEVGKQSEVLNNEEWLGVLNNGPGDNKGSGAAGKQQQALKLAIHPHTRPLRHKSDSNLVSEQRKNNA